MCLSLMTEVDGDADSTDNFLLGGVSRLCRLIAVADFADTSSGNISSSSERPI